MGSWMIAFLIGFERKLLTFWKRRSLLRENGDRPHETQALGPEEPDRRLMLLLIYMGPLNLPNCDMNHWTFVKDKRFWSRIQSSRDSAGPVGMYQNRPNLRTTIIETHFIKRETELGLLSERQSFDRDVAAVVYNEWKSRKNLEIKSFE